MVRESDYFHKGMTSAERDDAIERYVKACEKANQQIPMWIRMQLDEEEIIPPDPELVKELDKVDREFGIKK